jgi:hypothetical protein
VFPLVRWYGTRNGAGKTTTVRILGKAVPLWLVAVLGLAIGAAVSVFVDRYPRLPRSR